MLEAGCWKFELHIKYLASNINRYQISIHSVQPLRIILHLVIEII